MKQIACDDCGATFPVRNSIFIAKVKAVFADWTVGGIYYNHDHCPDHSPRKRNSR